MKKDLSKDIYSATAAFESVLPAVVAIKNSSNDESSKKENAIILIIGALCKKRSDCPNETKGISRPYIEKVRKIINEKDDIDGIIRYLNNVIKAGKNYNGGN